MGNLNLDRTMERIEAARPHSPIAVFRTNVVGCLRSVFADTCMTYKEAKTSASFLGYFDCTSDQKAVRNMLRDYIRQEDDK